MFPSLSIYPNLTSRQYYYLHDGGDIEGTRGADIDLDWSLR